MKRILAGLSYRERRCLELEAEGKTLDEIAATFQVTPERIRQIIDQARLVLKQTPAADPGIEVGGTTHKPPTEEKE